MTAKKKATAKKATKPTPVKKTGQPVRRPKVKRASPTEVLKDAAFKATQIGKVEREIDSLATTLSAARKTLKQLTAALLKEVCDPTQGRLPLSSPKATPRKRAAKQKGDIK